MSRKTCSPTTNDTINLHLRTVRQAVRSGNCKSAKAHLNAVYDLMGGPTNDMGCKIPRNLREYAKTIDKAVRENCRLSGFGKPKRAKRRR